MQNFFSPYYLKLKSVFLISKNWVINRIKKDPLTIITIYGCIFLFLTALLLLCFWSMEDARSFMLMVAGLIGFPFLVWRSEIADRTQKQAVTAHFTIENAPSKGQIKYLSKVKK